MITCLTTPVRVILDTTRRCNLSCWYCHSTSGPQYQGPELTGEDVTNVYRSANQLKVFDITLTGGEPLLWTGLQQALKDSSLLDYPALQLITNATVLTKQRLEWLKQANIQRINVSLDGLEEGHTKGRSVGQYSKILDGIQDIRKVVDNITVISVIDRTNADDWPELTKMLLQIGVKQHHLTAVCFAGDAMSDYRGLTKQQFMDVRLKIEQMRQELPPWFHLRFNDVLLRGLTERIVPMHIFTEGFKGWHVVVRPDGNINGYVRAWGRSWRENEMVGSIKDRSLADTIIDIHPGLRLMAKNRFSVKEEVQRKFHLDTTQEMIANDVDSVRAIESGQVASLSQPKNDIPLTASADQGQAARALLDSSWLELTQPDLMVDVDLEQQVAREPLRYRLRVEPNFGGLLFDRVTFDVTVLTHAETQTLAASLPTSAVATLLPFA